MASQDRVGLAAARAEGFWSHKPWWCQPWSILTTGVVGMAADGLVFRVLPLPWWLGVGPVVAILGWWLLFLVMVPAGASHDSSR